MDSSKWYGDDWKFVVDKINEIKINESVNYLDTYSGNVVMFWEFRWKKANHKSKCCFYEL